MWTVTHDSFSPQSQHHHETIFTIGNGYLSTRGVFEEGYPGERRATFVHGVFDDAPIVLTELANAPDWLPLAVYLDGERFSLDRGAVESFRRTLDLRTGVLTRTVRWRSPQGRGATLTFERFASLANEHALLVRCTVTPDFAGVVEFRAALDGNSDNEHGGYWLAHWRWLEQGKRDGIVFLRSRTRRSQIELALAMRLAGVFGKVLEREYWDADNRPTIVLRMEARPGENLIVDKFVGIATSRDDGPPLDCALATVAGLTDWASAYQANAEAWAKEWERTDVVIEGDDEAQLALRFNLFHLLIAAPRHDDRVNIGAKTLSGYGYRGHVFWDTELFMLPLFTYTAPHIARNLLNYRYRTLPAARAKAQAKGYEGAWFAWESADTGKEVTPTWIPDFNDRTKLARVWTGDLAIHISADVAYAVHQYWQVSGDDAWFIDRGAELILDTAKFYGARAEWNAEKNCYEYTDVIGPDEYHDHVNNNAYTNRLAQWNLQTALEVLAWLREHAPEKAAALTERLDLSAARLARWRDVIEKIRLHVLPNGLIEQFDGFFQLKDVNLADYEPRTKSMHEIFGIEAANHYQVIKQPDVLMLQYLLHDHYSDDVIRANYDYYNPRTDHTYGSSLGPSIQAIIACMIGYLEDAYEHFMRAARADLRDVRSNAGDGIHAASAGGTWQAVVFGFAGLRVRPDGWSVMPRLPHHWKRVAFKFFHHGQLQHVEVVSSS
ncbi:MAG: glycoside hydrolase family 65 protein [Anaerolineales bacterium]|nr:glycoside hydrolase family 65 protein [Anaerolineales bacterium]